ncbi:MAG: tyrosine-protein phosphatase [Bacilli bacterium]|nr:tyrosine-protein phosphatase [Bacilli bacterium]
MKNTKKYFLCISLSLLLTACGGGKKPVQSSEEVKSEVESSEPAFELPVADDVFIDTVTEFDEPQSVYTEKQKAFLIKDGLELGELSQADAALLADGKSNLSSPEPLKIEWEHEAGADFDKYEVDVYEWGKTTDPVVVESDTTSANVYNLFAGKYYYQVKAVYQDGHEEVSDYYPVEMDMSLGNGEYGTIRTFHVDGITNCRDLGGTKLAGGGTLKYGQLYRTSAFADYNMDKKTITDAGREVVKSWGVKTEIELRGGPSGTGGESSFATAETVSEIPGVDYKFVPWAYQNGKNLIYRNIEPLRKTFDILGDASNYPIDFHCRIGTDRTGAVALLVNGLVGVSLGDIYKDYMFSNFGNIGKTTYVNQQNDDSTRAYVQEIMTFPGENFHNKVYSFLRTIGVSAEKLDTIIDVLTDGEKVTGNPNTTVVDAKTATGDGVLSEQVAVRDPAAYVKLAANKSSRFKLNLEEDTKGRLFASMKIASITASNKFSTVLSAQVNGTDVDLVSKDRPVGWGSSVTNGLGLNGDYWIPVEIADLDLYSGENIIDLTALTNNVQISHVAFLPME